MPIPNKSPSIALCKKEHPSEGALNILDTGIKLDDQSLPIRHHQPDLGEHTVEVLEQAGLSPSEVKALAEQAKMSIGTASTHSKAATMEIKGRDLVAGIPKVVVTTSDEIREAWLQREGKTVSEENPIAGEAEPA